MSDQPISHDARQTGCTHAQKSHRLVTNTMICLSLAVVAYYLFTEHYAHLMGALPYLLLLSCPLMHLFMHRSHEHSHCNHTSHEASGET